MRASSSRGSRRRFLRHAAVLGACLASPPLRAVARFARDPFTLGVASGYPTPDGIALWTRLAPEPLVPGGGMPELAVPVGWEIAADEGFARIVAQGSAEASPQWAHSVHVEAQSLAPARVYWYRFHAGDATSPSGRFRTAPAPGDTPQALRFAVASCQHYEHGHYAAYRHIAADAPDLVLHVGDYIYELSWGEDLVRRHDGGEPITLDAYRARYACYKADDALKAAHAACAWLVTWDDHEVENDYVGAHSENADDPHWFLARRAAAYQAYYEHMPLRRAMLPVGPDMRLYTRVPYGRLAEFNVLDGRQYRSPQPCPRPGRGGSNSIENCAARLDPAASFLGAEQEHWLGAGLASSRAHWNLLAQQTLMAQSDSRAGPGEKFNSDTWDGYPVARQRLLDFIAERAIANPLVLGGDVHSFWVNELKRDFTRSDSAIVASEFVTTSISSRPPGEALMDTAAREGPHIRLATGRYRGYLRMTLTPAHALGELRALDDVRQPDSACTTFSSWVVEDGRPGPQPA